MKCTIQISLVSQ